MKPWMLALLLDRPELVTLPPFTSNTSWTAPANVGQLVSVVGKGEDGAPAVDGDFGYNELYTLTVNGVVEEYYFLPTVYGALPPPENYCEEIAPGRVACHQFSGFDNRRPAKTGSDATGFGKTFPGGAGTAAAPATIESVPVIPNQSYQLNIPPGGSITISYYR